MSTSNYAGISAAVKYRPKEDAIETWVREREEDKWRIENMVNRLNATTEFTSPEATCLLDQDDYLEEISRILKLEEIPSRAGVSVSTTKNQVPNNEHEYELANLVAYATGSQLEDEPRRNVARLSALNLAEEMQLLDQFLDAHMSDLFLMATKNDLKSSYEQPDQDENKASKLARMGKTIRHHSPQHDVSVYEIPCHVGKNTTNALGDMGARHNFMKKSIAHKWGLTINHTAQLRVRLGSGREIYSTEKVTAQFSFLKESQTYELEFWLLPDCVHDVILGKLFLNVSKTFSSVANCLRRVKERVVKRLSHFDLLYVSGGNGPMFKGFLDGTPYLALGDTGAKVAVLDEDQAWHAGISYDTGPEHCTTLRFVDGSKKDTSGTAYGVEWRFGDDQVPYLLDFHILKNAPAKAILPDSLLFSTMAFCRYADFLIDSDDGDTSHCFLIDQDLKRQIETGSTIADLEFQETVRQGEVMDHIASLNEPERQTAWDQERQRRARWALNMQVIRQSQAHGFQASSPQITGLPGTEDARLPGTHCVGPPETHNVEPPGIHGVGPSRNNDVEPLRIQGVWPPGTQNPGSFRTPGDTGDAPDPPSRKRIYWKQVFRWKQAFRFT